MQRTILSMQRGDRFLGNYFEQMWSLIILPSTSRQTFSCNNEPTASPNIDDILGNHFERTMSVITIKFAQVKSSSVAKVDDILWNHFNSFASRVIILDFYSVVCWTMLKEILLR
jgi:hypothetical protein